MSRLWFILLYWAIYVYSCSASILTKRNAGESELLSLDTRTGIHQAATSKLFNTSHLHSQAALHPSFSYLNETVITEKL